MGKQLAAFTMILNPQNKNTYVIGGQGIKKAELVFKTTFEFNYET